MKNITKYLALFIFVLASIISLTACSTSLSGKYVSQLESGYIEFHDKNKVTLYDSGGDFPLGITGTYEVKGKKLILTFDIVGYSSDIELDINKDNNIISYNYHDFVKESEVFTIPWWGWCLIVILGLSLISWIYKLVTKRDLEDDIDKLGDKFEEFAEDISEKLNN